MHLNDLKFCFCFDKKNDRHRHYIESVALPRLEEQLRLLSVIQSENNPVSKEFFEYETQIQEHHDAIEKAKSKLFVVPEQTNLFHDLDETKNESRRY